MAPMMDISPSKRRIVGVNEETVTDVAATDFPGHYYREDHSWSLDKFEEENLKVQFHNNEDFDASFSLVGLDAAIANAFRRIMIAEIPTLAIEQVFVHINTSIIHDEILAQRLGLIPLRGQPEFMRWLKNFKRVEPGTEGGSEAYDENTVVLKLQVECSYTENGKKAAIAGETNPEILYKNSTVYARQMVFEATGAQKTKFPHNVIEAVNPDIILAKMRPKQKIDVVMWANKGYGADHAKFSPVCTASYRLMPHIDILRPIIGADASKFARCFNAGVIGKVPVTKKEAAVHGSGYEGHEGEMKAVVVNPMKDAVTRECLRHDEFKEKVRLGRIRDHFIFHVESTGQYRSDELFLESVRILKEKARKMNVHLGNLIGTGLDEDDAVAGAEQDG